MLPRYLHWIALATQFTPKYNPDTCIVRGYQPVGQSITTTPVTRPQFDSERAACWPNLNASPGTLHTDASLLKMSDTTSLCRSNVGVSFNMSSSPVFQLKLPTFVKKKIKNKENTLRSDRLGFLARRRTPGAAGTRRPFVPSCDRNYIFVNLRNRSAAPLTSFFAPSRCKLTCGNVMLFPQLAPPFPENQNRSGVRPSGPSGTASLAAPLNKWRTRAGSWRWLVSAIVSFTGGHWKSLGVKSLLYPPNNSMQWLVGLSVNTF